MGNDKRTLADADSANDIEHAPTQVLWETVEMLQNKGQGLEDAASQNVLIDELDERGVSLSLESTRHAALASERVSEYLLSGTRLGEAWNRTRGELGLPKEARMSAETMRILAERHPSFLRTKLVPVVGASHTAGASEEYATKWSDVMAKVDRVQAALAAHRQEQLRAPTDYGYVGDLGNVGEYLDNILTFLKG